MRLNRTRFLPLMLWAISLSASDASPSKFPADVQTTLDREVAQEAAVKAECDQKISKLRSELVTRLQKAQEAATKKGDLDVAMAIKSKIADIDQKAGPMNVPRADDPDVRGSYKCTHTNDPVKEIFLKDNGQGLTGFGDKFIWAVKDGMLTFTWKDGSISKGEVHPKVIVMTSTGKTASGEERCGYYLERQ